MQITTNNQVSASNEPHATQELHKNEDSTYVALIHGIGATNGEAWTRQSVQTLLNWWITVQRGVDAESVSCLDGCELGPGHQHLRLSAQGCSRRVDLEALFWGDCVRRPGAGKCARLVLQAGMLIGLVDTLTAWLTAFERLAESTSEVGLAHATWRLISSFLRALMAPLVTLFVAGAVLVNPRLRSTIGDALAWSTDEHSREVVKQKLTDALRGAGTLKVVLIGHSQGGSIAAELEPELRAEGREVRLVTLGSGHGLLAAMHNVLPRWSLAKSLVSWTALIAFSALTIAALTSVLEPALHTVAPLAAAPLRIAGYAWLTNLLPLTEIRGLVHGIDVAPVINSQLTQPFYLPPIAIPAEIASTVLAVLLLTIGLEPARSLSAATHTEAPGIDIVATHDLVAAAMLQVGPVERRRRVRQCGSLLLDHTSYLRNGSVVLGLLAEQVEHAAGLPEDDDNDLGATAMEEYHGAGLAMRGWTRPLLCALIVGAFGWFAGGRIAPAIWLPTAGACCLAASFALTASSARWLTHALYELDASYWMAVVRERERWRRAQARWAGIWALAGTPLIGGAAVALTTPIVLHSLTEHPELLALTFLAFILGAVIYTLAWRSLFGFQRGVSTTIALMLAALLWLLQGTPESTGMATALLALAYFSYRREHRERRQFTTEWSQVSYLLPELSVDTPDSGEAIVRIADQGE